MEITNNDYYYGNEAEQYIFYRIPKALFTDPNFKSLSLDAKVLYGLMLDRMGLSIKNNWYDKQNKVYIYFTLEDTQEYMNCGHTKGVKVMAELEKVGLIERIKQGQGKPAKIYVKKFFTGNDSTYKTKDSNNHQEKQDIQKQEKQTCINDNSGFPQMRSKDFIKEYTNNNDFNNNEFNDIEYNKSKSCQVNRNDFDKDVNNDIDKYKEYVTGDEKQKELELYIKEQINYDLLISHKSIEKDEVDSIVLIIVDTLLSSSPKIRVNGEDKPQSIVKSMLMKITWGSIIYIINKSKEQKNEIKHKKSYLLTCLYNAQMEGVYNGINYLKRIEVL